VIYNNTITTAELEISILIFGFHQVNFGSLSMEALHKYFTKRKILRLVEVNVAKGNLVWCIGHVVFYRNI
jgi:hypothetical protein